MSGRRRFGALLVALAGLLCVACIPSKPLRLGFIVGLSGPVADLGESGRDGALLAVEEINAAGGIGGRRVELHLIDDGQDEEQAAAAVETLAREGVELIIGPLTSAMGVAALPVAERLGVLLVSPTITASRFVGRDDQLLLVSPHVGEITRRFAVHLHAQGVRRLALAYDTRNLAFSADWALHLREALRALGTEVVAEVPFVSGEFASYETSLRELLAAHPDALHFVASAVDTVRLLQVVRLLHVDLPSSAAAWAATEHLIQLGGRSVEGLVVSQLFARDDARPRFQAFRTAFRARFNQEPGFVAVAAYDATCAALTAYAKRAPGASLKATLLSIPAFEGVQQTWSFDAQGDATRQVSVARVHDGRFVALEDRFP